MVWGRLQTSFENVWPLKYTGCNFNNAKLNEYTYFPHDYKLQTFSSFILVKSQPMHPSCPEEIVAIKHSLPNLTVHAENYTNGKQENIRRACISVFSFDNSTTHFNFLSGVWTWSTNHVQYHVTPLHIRSGVWVLCPLLNGVRVFSEPCWGDFALVSRPGVRWETYKILRLHIHCYWNKQLIVHSALQHGR